MVHLRLSCVASHCSISIDKCRVSLALECSVKNRQRLALSRRDSSWCFGADTSAENERGPPARKLSCAPVNVACEVDWAEVDSAGEADGTRR